MSQYQPSLLGGLFIGILSALPGVQLGNCCCCLWVVSGGVITTYLMQQRTPVPLETGDTVLAGLIAGIFGGFVFAVFGLALGPLFAQFQEKILRWVLVKVQELPDLPADSRTQIEEALEEAGHFSVIGHLVQAAILTVIFAVVAMLGALLGLAFFKKKPVPPPPAPVQP
jgi:hypothetical protein